MFASTLTIGSTVADVPLWRIGAPFWGLVIGYATSWLLERGDLQAQRTR